MITVPFVVKSLSSTTVDVVVVVVVLSIEDIVVLSAGKLSADLFPATTTGIVIINIDDTTPSSTNAKVYLFFSFLIWFL